MRLPISFLTLSPLEEHPIGDRIRSEHQFAIALDQLAQVPVLRTTALPGDAPGDSFLIAFQGDIETVMASCPSERCPEIARRTVVMEDKWPRLFSLLEEHSLTAAVDIRRYWKWSEDPDHDAGGGIYGLISVAERAGMTYESGREFGSERYGMLACRDHCRDLPSLLVHYLTVYEEMGLHLRGPNNV